MPAPKTRKTKTTTKPVTKSTTPASSKSSAPKPAPTVPNRRAQRTTYAKMGAALNKMGKNK